MRYLVTAWMEVAVDCIVEAKNEDEAKEKTESALYGEEYTNGSFGVKSNDYDVEVAQVDTCDDYRIGIGDVLEYEGSDE